MSKGQGVVVIVEKKRDDDDDIVVIVDYYYDRYVLLLIVCYWLDSDLVLYFNHISLRVLYLIQLLMRFSTESKQQSFLFFSVYVNTFAHR